ERRDDERYGDLAARDGRLWCVRESAVGDELVEIGPGGEVRVLTRTDGFLGSPRPTDGALAWLRWDHDRMPWDGSELMLAQWRDAEVGAVRRLAGGREESVTQPSWAGANRLSFISDRTGWWNLYTWRDGEVTPAAPMTADVAPPQWE